MNKAQISEKIRLIRDWEVKSSKLPPCAATIGNFDGLHLGHRQIIEKLVKKANELNLVSTVITFEPLPQSFLRPQMPFLRLMTLSEKLTLLKEWGVNQVVCLRFNATIAALSPLQFIESYLDKAIKVRHLIVGEDFRFGHNQLGDVQLLKNNAQQFGFVVEPISLIVKKDKISSTLIRQALVNGDLASTVSMLGRNYSLTQRVVKGAMRGRQLGFPTANLRLNPHFPIRGVFVTSVEIDKKKYLAVTNVGTRPTVDGKTPLAEVHVLDFSGNLYGKRIKVEFLHKIRDEIQFANIEQLKLRIANDICKAQELMCAKIIKF